LGILQKVGVFMPITVNEFLNAIKVANIQQMMDELVAN